MIPRRRKAPKSNIRPEPQIRCPGHLAWVRGHECTVPGIVGMSCSERIEAAHVRTGTDGGMGVKPGDNWVIPLCSAHHAQQHHFGEAVFEKAYRINMKSIAEQLWLKSPAGRKYREARSPAVIYPNAKTTERR